MELQIRKKTIKIVGIVAIGIVAIFVLQLLLTSGKNKSEVNGVNSTNTQSSGNVDKIQVVHFHATQQCWSCITVGEYAEKTIKERFPEEYASGKIEYLDINGELSENSAIVNKFGASGSSLFVNVIKDGKDNISEDVQVWRLVSNEQSFINYFENRLKGYLKNDGFSKSDN